MDKVYDPIMCMMVEQRTNDAANGSVEYYYEMMKGKSKPDVEKIVMKAKGNPNAEKAYLMWKSNTHDARTCDADPVFKNIYDSFTRSLNAAGKMDPDAAQTYIQKIIIGHINSMNDRFNTISSEHTDLCNKIRKEGQEELRKVIDKYRRENR